VAGLLTLVAAALERLEFVVCEGHPEQEQPACCLARACLPHLREIAHSEVTGSSQPVASALCTVRVTSAVSRSSLEDLSTLPHLRFVCSCDVHQDIGRGSPWHAIRT